jgi:hypothetical protein
MTLPVFIDLPPTIWLTMARSLSQSDLLGLAAGVGQVVLVAVCVACRGEESGEVFL